MLIRPLIFTVSFFSALMITAPAIAQSQDYDIRPKAARLVSKDITKNFSGLTHTGAYNFNAQGNPGNRYTEWHNADGGILYSEGGRLTKGQWTVARDMMCYKYDDNALASGCFRIYKLGTCFYFYSASLLEKDDELARDYWTARSVQKGKPATCEQMVS